MLAGAQRRCAASRLSAMKPLSLQDEVQRYHPGWFNEHSDDEHVAQLEHYLGHLTKSWHSCACCQQNGTRNIV